MTSRNVLFTVALAVALAMPAFAEQPAAPAPQAATKAPQQTTFVTAEDAVAALVAAVRAVDGKALVTVVGPSSKSWISSGDAVSDRADWKRFLELYDVKHAIVPEGDARATLTVGDDPWPFPAPLVKKSGRWHFDAEAGRDEVLNRRIGHNELDTIQTLLAIVDAQRDYAATASSLKGMHFYASRFMSTPGKKDGLYWATKAGEAQSPLGPLVAEAAAQGYSPSSSGPRPYHGYLFRMLTAQGPDAAGGAYDYLVRDKLLGGFAVIAWPAKYDASGIMTFIVNHDGVVYQKDLGGETAARAAKISRFNPDKTWKRAQD